MIHLCSNCINAIRSRGEPVFTGDSMYFETEPDKLLKCDWCEEEYEASDIYPCIFK